MEDYSKNMKKKSERRDKVKSSNRKAKSKMQKESSNEENFYYALNHEIRRKIIRIIGEKGESSFTHFKKELKVSTGTLYHHLDVLGDLITQNSKKKYILTSLGEHAFNFLSKNYDSLEADKISAEKNIDKKIKKIIDLTIPKKIFNLIDKKPFIGILFTFIILLYGSLMVSMGNLNSYYIFFIPNLEETNINLLFKLGLIVKFLAGIIAAALTSEFLCRFLFNKPENTKKFLITYSINIYPILIYLSLYNLIQYFYQGFATNILNKVIMIFFQGWTIWLLSYSFIKFKFIKLERALITSLLIHYGAFSILLFSML
ncbi:MAG: hypothetical protein ACTSRZ_05200 [Promethearchaeota archaeon]